MKTTGVIRRIDELGRIVFQRKLERILELRMVRVWKYIWKMILLF